MYVTRKDQRFVVLDGPQQEMERCVPELYVKKAGVAEVYAEVPMSVYVWMVELHHHAPSKSPMIVSAL